MAKLKSIISEELRHLDIIPGSLAAIKGELAKIPVEVHDYPVPQVQDGLPFRDDKIEHRIGYKATQADLDMYEDYKYWDFAYGNLVVEDVINEVTLTGAQLARKNELIKVISHHKREFTKKYGKDANKVIAGIANKQALKEDTYDDLMKKADFHAAMGKEAVAEKLRQKAQALLLRGTSNKIVKEDLRPKTYKNIDTRTDIEVNPTDAATALVLARRYTALAGEEEDPHIKQQHEDTAQRFFDVYTRIKNEHKTNPPKKHLFNHNRVGEENLEEEEVTSTLAAVRIAAQSPEGVELELPTGAVLDITQSDAIDILNQFHTEEAINEFFDSKEADNKLAHLKDTKDIWDDYKNNLMLYDLLVKHHDLPIWDDSDPKDRAHKKETRDHARHFKSEADRNKKQVTNSMGSDCADDMHDCAVANLKHFHSLPIDMSAPLPEDATDNDPNFSDDNLFDHYAHLRNNRDYLEKCTYSNRDDRPYPAENIYQDRNKLHAQAYRDNNIKRGVVALGAALGAIDNYLYKERGEKLANAVRNNGYLFSSLHNNPGDIYPPSNEIIGMDRLENYTPEKAIKHMKETKDKYTGKQY